MPDRRALLVGINEYPDPRLRLEGCANDVFLFSSVLQANVPWRPRGRRRSRRKK